MRTFFTIVFNKICMHIIIVQIVIHTVNVDSFEIEKIKFDLKLHALTSKVGRYIAKIFKQVIFSIEILKNYKSIMPRLQVWQSFIFPIQIVIMKMMNLWKWWQSNIVIWFTLKLYFHFVKWLLCCLNGRSHNFFIPPCLLSKYAIFWYLMSHMKWSQYHLDNLVIHKVSKCPYSLCC